jgi:hypothetical protein
MSAQGWPSCNRNRRRKTTGLVYRLMPTHEAPLERLPARADSALMGMPALTRRSQKIYFRRKRGSGVYPGGGHRKMSKADHDEALQWRWLYIPLVAFLVLAVGPSVLAPIFFVLSLFVDVSSIVGPVQRAPDLISILVFPLLLGLMALPVAVWFRSRRIDRRPVF